jgi:hypothetical protein
MYTDIVQLKLQKPVTEPDEGIPLTTLGKIIFDLKKKQCLIFDFNI